MNTIKAMLFDVFGTVVDWRGSIIREGATWNAHLTQPVDWASFADAWRAGCFELLAQIGRGEVPWMTFDQVNHTILDRLIDQFGIEGWSNDQRDTVNRVWHRLHPWPDAVAGLLLLRRRFIIAPLSNGNMALLTNMAKFVGLPWDCILSAELARVYKPDPAAYLTAAALLDLPPAAIMMVAAHQPDLRAARQVGFKTAFVPRPQEFGPQDRRDLTPDLDFDLVADDFLALAAQVGANEPDGGAEAP